MISLKSFVSVCFISALLVAMSTDAAALTVTSIADAGGSCPDGLMLIRYLFGLRGSSLISGAIGSGVPTRTMAPEIETYIRLLMP